jgi:hypothetical protein
VVDGLCYDSAAKRRFNDWRPQVAEQAHDKQGKRNGNHDSSIEIEVVTTADDLDDRFNTHEPLRVVFERALTLVGGHSNPDQFALEFGNEPLTDLDRTIGDYASQLGWGERVELELVPKPVVV